MQFKFISAILISTILAGCGSAPVYQITPVTGGHNYHLERGILSVEDEDAKTVLNYDAQAGEYFSFFLTIENKSDSAVTVYPEEFYAEVYMTDSLTDEPLHIFAYNPEYQLKTIDEEISSLNSQKSFNDGLNCFLLGAVVVTEVTEIGKEETEEEEISDEEFKQMVFDKIDQDQINYEDELYELEKEKDHWQYEAMRITTLKPGEKMAGIFYLRIYQNTKWLKTVIPIGNKEYVYNYKQDKK